MGHTNQKLKLAEFTIISEVQQTKAALKELYDFLIDFKNFRSILPEDKVENFEYTSDSCSFNIKGITALSIKVISKTPYTSVKFQSEGLAKFNFILEAKFAGAPQSTGQCSIELFGDMNPFIKTMAEKPLITLVNTMAMKLAQLEVGKE
ncbi:MAG TPA: hypothetical protein VN026_17390 [Bacteroidia bacterium]|jgi:hypothetical protein|nr:hypothetical protein [Bacteroidia bacterium]